MLVWKNPQHSKRRVDILLFDAFSALCLANTVEPLRAANSFLGRAYVWNFLSLDGESVRSSSDMQVTPNAALKDGFGDLLIVMPSYRFLEHDTELSRKALRSASRRYARLAGFDTGSWLLASAGLLEGYDATIHWDELERFEEAFPDTNVLRKDHVQDRDRLTCRGAQTAFQLMLELVAEIHGASIRLDVAGLLGAGERNALAPIPLARNALVSRAVSLMQSRIEDPLGLDEIARRVGRSQRDLQTKFQQEFGTSPRIIYRHLRLGRARKLVEETEMPVSEIAVRCGYENPAAMTRAFRREFGDTPQSIRRSS